MAIAEPGMYSPKTAFVAGDDEHPLQWLQPTPQNSPPAPVHLRPTWSVAQAADMLGAVSFTLLSTTLRDGVPQGQMLPDRASSVRRTEGLAAFTTRLMSSPRKPVPRPPQLTPPISSMRTQASPLPPPAGSPQVLVRVPSDTSTTAPSRESTFDEHDDCSPELQVAAGSFLELTSWSAAVCEGRDPEASRREAGPSFEAMGTEVDSTVPFRSLPSAGSMQHNAGMCKPCAFFHRPIGCAAGVECKFCHLCNPGEKKRRQKQKFEVMRLRRLSRKAGKAAENDGSRVHVDSI